VRWLRNGTFETDACLNRPELIAVGEPLAPGQYRFESLSPTGEVLAQHDHRESNDSLSDPRRITLRTPSEALLRSMRQFRPGAALSGEAALPELEGDYAELGGDLWIQHEPARVGDLHEFLNADPKRLAYLGFQGFQRAEPDDERRVCLPRLMLEEACNYYGMRLPSLGELHAAFRCGAAVASRTGVTMEALCGVMGPTGLERLNLAFSRYEQLGVGALAELQTAVTYVGLDVEISGVDAKPSEIESLGKGVQFRFAFGAGLGVRPRSTPQAR
jgi:hypothetical protein